MSARGVTALVPAAGLSGRMGRFKPLMEVGGMTAIERTVAAFRAAGIDDVVIVTGFRKELLSPLLDRLGVRNVVNEHFSDGMFSSIRAGFKALSPGVPAVFVLPADIPLVRPWTMRYLMERLLSAPGKIITPSFMGQSGHPPLIPADFVNEIVNWDGPDGLKGALARFEGRRLTVSVPDRNILFDMDTMDDYESLSARWKRYGIPTADECEILLDEIFRLGAEVMAHCRAVAGVAGRIADLLNEAGNTVDRELVCAAGLLHDMMRERPDHAREAGGLLREMGFAAAARVVEAHMDIEPGDERSVNEAEILYLADKMVLEDRVVPLAERFAVAMRRFGTNPEAARRISGRHRNAAAIKEKITALTGMKILHDGRSTRAGAAP